MEEQAVKYVMQPLLDDMEKLSGRFDSMERDLNSRLMRIEDRLHESSTKNERFINEAQIKYYILEEIQKWRSAVSDVVSPNELKKFVDEVKSIREMQQKFLILISVINTLFGAGVITYVKVFFADQ